MTDPIVKPLHEHELKATEVQDVWYPDHAPRVATALFAKNRKHIIEELDTPCWICGTKENREFHHFYVEDAFSDAIDWEKVKPDHPDFDWSTFKESSDFVDSSYNLKVLCQEHHRKKDRGIHNLTLSVWSVQKYVRDGFELFTGADTTELTPDLTTIIEPTANTVN